MNILDGPCKKKPKTAQIVEYGAISKHFGNTGLKITIASHLPAYILHQ